MILATATASGWTRPVTAEVPERVAERQPRTYRPPGEVAATLQLLKGDWWFRDQWGGLAEFTFRSDGTYTRLYIDKWGSSDIRHGRFAVERGGQLRLHDARQLFDTSVVPGKTLTLWEGFDERRYTRGRLPRLSRRAVVGRWRSTYRRGSITDAGPGIVHRSELTFERDGRFHWVRVARLDPAQHLRGTYLLRPDNEIEFIADDHSDDAGVFKGRRVGRRLVLESADEGYEFEPGAMAGPPTHPAPPPCECDGTAFDLASQASAVERLLEGARPEEVGGGQARDEQLRRLARAFAGNAPPVALVWPVPTEDAGPLHHYLVAHAGRVQLVIKAEGAIYHAAKVCVCVASAFSLTAVRDRQRRAIEPTDTGPGPLDVLVQCDWPLDFPAR